MVGLRDIKIIRLNSFCKKTTMDNPPELQLLAARVCLLHMGVYADGMLRMVSYGLLRAKDDDAFFQEMVRRDLPQLNPNKISEIAQLKKEIDLDQTLKGSKAASLIFMHAGVESCLTDLAKLIADLDPHSFVPLLKGKQISFETAFKGDALHLLREQALVYLETMERQSLVHKTRTMFRILKDPSLETSDFDEIRVKRIENLRNDCAHGRVDVADFSTYYEDLSYLKTVGNFFVNAIAKKYNIPNPKFDEFGLEEKQDTQ